MTNKEEMEALKKRVSELENKPNVVYVPIYQPVYYQPYQWPYYYQLGISNTAQGSM